MNLRFVLAVLVVLFIGAVFVCIAQQRSQSGELYYSGTIEATESNLAFQAPGRVREVLVREGEPVTRGQLLARLDKEEFIARLDQARAALERAMKNQAQLESLLDVYEKTLPAEVDRAQAAVTSAEKVLAESRRDYERYENLFARGVVAQKERDAVKLSYEVNKGKLEEMQAVLSQARSNLTRIDAARTDVAAARAQVAACRAALAQAEIQLQYTELRAPYAGFITSRNVEPGEVVTPSREVLTLADLSQLDLKIFVDETEIGKVKPGQRVDVKVDTFPGRVFPGRVSFISPEGEFTPKIIQTHKERVKLVYLVKVTMPNPDLALKPGMPADAWLR